MKFTYLLPRIGFIDIPSGKLCELKPNNPRAIKEGHKQIQSYNDVRNRNPHKLLKVKIEMKHFFRLGSKLLSSTFQAGPIGLKEDKR